jgi:hypothetical protein
MATSPFSPNVIVQDTYLGSRGRAAPGERPLANIYQDRPKENCAFTAANASQVNTITITAAVAGQSVAVVIDGVSVPFTAGASVNATATAGAAALDAAAGGGLLLEGVIDTSATQAAAAVITLAFADEGPHAVSFTPAAGTTATVAETTAGASSVIAVPGTVAVYAESQDDPSFRAVALPGAADATTAFSGIVARSPYPANQTPANPFLLPATGGWPPGVPHREWEKGEVEALIASDVTPADSVYYVTAAGANRGKLVGSAGGASQVSQLTVTPSATDTVGFHFDALPALTVTSVDLATDNAALRDLFNGNAQYAAIGTAVVAAGKIDITFSDKVAHTFSDDSSGGTADVAHALVTAASAATAALLPGAKFTESRTAAQGTVVVDLG